jgi:hypothetical protein
MGEPGRPRKGLPAQGVTLILVAMSRQYESYVPMEKIELVAPLQYGFEVPV